MASRNFNSNEYRYGMNTQEKDNEIFEGAYSAQYWEYDSRLGRRWNLDPVVKHQMSSYACFSGNPILRNDPNGDDDFEINKKSGKINLTKKTDAKEHTIYNSDKSSSLNVGLDFFKTKTTGSEDSKEGKKEFTFITSKNLKELKGAYEFFASNSDTEWGYSEFEGKSKVGLLVTSHTEGTPEKAGTLRNWVDIAGKVLDINKGARLIYASHSHPGKFSEWSQWPAYPSGFTYLGKVRPEEGGDRDNYEYYEKYYKDRIPSMFNIFVPSKPKLDVMYDAKHFKTEYKK